MKRGYLSEYFKGVAAKRLSDVEVNDEVSNQHEFNGVRSLVSILGEPVEKGPRKTQFMYLTDFAEPVSEEGSMTWYDARKKAREERGIMRYEYRLYFPDNSVTTAATAGDLLVIAVQQDGSLLALMAASGSTIENQIVWLFGLSDISDAGFSVREHLESDRDRIALISRLVLESIGVEVVEEDESALDDMLKQFGTSFPTTKVFSEYARSTVPGVHVTDDPDSVLMAWYEREETLFRTLEKHLISERLREGFEGDVEKFLGFSLSVQNRRKSRAGFALENHLEQLFKERGIRFSRTHATESRSKPDFLFPGASEYQDQEYDPKGLTMLGVKTTCKDRWRQVLTEAARIPEKHLLTLEAAISRHQTDEMKRNCLRLVLPEPVRASYTEDQQAWSMNLDDFCTWVMERQPPVKQHSRLL